MKNYLLSYPRSGNTWLRYCVETLSGENTIGYENSNHFERGVLEKYRKSKKPILYKRHETEGVDNSENNRIILIVRNYKEVIVRHNGKVKSIMQDYDTKNRISYLKLLRFYDSFIGNKLIIYYEDLIEDLENTLKDVFSFLEIDIEKSKMENFFLNIEEHKSKSLKIYGESQTKGKSTIHHSKKLSEDEKNEWDNFLIENEKDIFSKYLERYKEINLVKTI